MARTASRPKVARRRRSAARHAEEVALVAEVLERDARHRRALAALHAMDAAAFAWSAQRKVPLIDRALLRLTHACDNGVLWFALTLGLSVLGGRRGRRAAMIGLGSLGVTSPLVNGPIKWLVRRQRPDSSLVPEWRRLRTVPRTTSFPSGHAASAWSFAAAATYSWPALGVGLAPMAAVIAWSRVHTGAHYPGDVIAGSAAGIGLGVAYAAWAPLVIPRQIPRLLRID